MSGRYMVSLIPEMRHGHEAGWNPPDSYTFAKSIIKTGTPWCIQTGSASAGNAVEVSFESRQPLDRAVLISTVDSGMTGKRNWVETPAELVEQGEYQWQAHALLPKGATAWFMNVRRSGLTVSSDFKTIP